MRVLVFVCHALLLAALAALILSVALPLEWRAGLLLAAAAPLLVALPGLARGRRYTLQWLSILLVVYVGVGVVEVVAHGARAPAASIALLAALVELAALLIVLRKRRAPSG